MMRPTRVVRESRDGSLLVGTKGTMYSPNDYGAKYILLPEKDFKDADFKNVPESLPRNGKGDSGQKGEWVEAIKNNKPEIALANFDYTGLLTESILLGNVAIRLNGQKLEWDGPSLKFTNNAKANQYLHYEYRKGWTL